jgi:hypothetical protein
MACTGLGRTKASRPPGLPGSLADRDPVLRRAVLPFLSGQCPSHSRVGPSTGTKRRISTSSANRHHGGPKRPNLA